MPSREASQKANAAQSAGVVKPHNFSVEHVQRVVSRSAVHAHVTYLVGLEGDKPIGDGHLLADEQRLRFQATATSTDERTAGSPMHNPFGRLKLISMRDIAETN